MRVGDVMRGDLHFLAPNATAQDAAQLMGDLGARCLPVGTEEDLQGIVTDGDLLIRVVAQGRDNRETRVAEIMSKGVIVCGVDDSTDSVVAEMESRNIRRMPVVDSAKRIVGLVVLDELAGPRPATPAASRDRDKPNAASILIVEDEEDIRELLAAMLADDGHQCAEAGTCSAACALIEAQGFDLVISDVRLPDGTGTDVVRAAKQAGMRCLMITGDANQMQRLEFRDEEYLAKPFRASELRERVRTLLPTGRVSSQKTPLASAAPKRRMAKWFPFRIA